MLSRNRRRGLPRIQQLVLVPMIATLAVVLSPIFSPAQQKPRVEKGIPVDKKAPAENPDSVWADRIEPLFDKKCLKCHAGVRQLGGLDLRSLDTILRGGDRGPAIIPGKPSESRILQFVQ